ncbi:MAG: type II toxin-antitoxin system VapC family toxin [Chloroflexi bacterium]|nr:type II toxin-antitoxin system VapC family toxin [Chloroflexota bacterium]
MKKRFVLDAWAILALLQKEEPAATRVQKVLWQGEKGAVDLFMSIINLGEVVYSVGKMKGEEVAFKTLADIRRLPLSIIPATEEAIFAAVRLKIRHPISYADAFAASTAISLKATLMTGDPELLQLGERFQVEKLQRH